MYRCKPQKNTKQLTVCFLTFIAVFVAVMLALANLTSYKGFFEILLILITVFFVYYIYRFSITEYEYQAGNGNFTVLKKVGSRVTTVCSLDLSTSLSLLPKDEFKERIKCRDLPDYNRKYFFNQNIVTSSYVYYSEFNSIRVAVIFEPNEAFVDAMLDEISRCKKD